jgi:hypothetical protein
MEKEKANKIRGSSRTLEALPYPNTREDLCELF